MWAQKFNCGDKVEVQGLTSEAGKPLNGLRGDIVCRKPENDRWKVLIAKASHDGAYTETKAGVYSTRKDSKTYNVKTANLTLIEAGLITKTTQGVQGGDADPASRQLEGLTIDTTASFERKNPGVKGFFDFINNGDAAGVQRVLQHISDTHDPHIAPANVILDAGGNTALYGALENGNPAVVALLIQHGADVTWPYMRNTPMGAKLDARPIHIAVGAFKGDPAIISMLAEVNASRRLTTTSS